MDDESKSCCGSDATCGGAATETPVPAKAAPC